MLTNKKYFDKLIFLFIALEVVSFVLILTTVLLLESQTFKNKSQILLDTLRNDYIISDLRNLNQKLQTAISQHDFLSAGFANGSSMERPRISFELKLFDGSLNIPVLANIEDNNSKISDFYVTYSYASAFLLALVLWAITSVALFAFIPLIKRHLEKKIFLQQEQVRLEKEFQTARQVAHDIRSPLSALEILAKTVTNLTDEQKSILKEVVQRVNGIADDLLKQSKSRQYESTPQAVGRHKLNHSCEISNVVKSLTTQKQLEFENNPVIKLHLRLHDSAKNLVVGISETILNRILSNLINNSVESISDNGDIYIEVAAHLKVCTVVLIDFGKGIPESILSQLKHKAISYGKELSTHSGSGIGIFSSSEFLTNVGGDLKIESRERVGTKVTISIPIVG